MASDNRPPSDNPGARRKRPPTVIDLEASEVSAAAAAPGQQSESKTEPVPVAEMPEPVPVTDPPVSQTATGATSQQSAPESEPAPESPRAKPESPSAPNSDSGGSPNGRSWAPLGAGLAGAAGALLVFLLLWLSGVLSGRPSSPQDLSPRLASIEQQLKDMADRPASAAADSKVLDTLASRLLKLETAQATPRAPVTDPVVLGRLGSTENAMKSLSDNVAALSRRTDAADAAVGEINSRIEKMNAGLNDVRTLARSAAAGSDRASRLALAASALRDAVEHGTPFAAELAVVKPLSPDAAAVAALEPFAASGVPDGAALGKELSAIVRPMLRAAGQPSSSGSFIDRLQANAEKLVRIRPVDETRGDDRRAVLARIDQRASQGDIAGALTELAKLPPDARAPAQGWIAKAEARDKAVGASRRLATDAIAALKVAP